MNTPREPIVCKRHPWEVLVDDGTGTLGSRMTIQGGDIDLTIEQYVARGYRLVTPDYFGWRKVFAGATE